MKRTFQCFFFVIAVGIAAHAGLVAAEEAPQVTAEILEQVQQMLADRPGDYAGSDICALCHNSNYWDFKVTNWEGTLHAQALRDPDQAPGIVPDSDFKTALNLSGDPDFNQYGASAPVLGYNVGDAADPADGTSGYLVTIGAVTYTIERAHGVAWKLLFQTRIGNSYYYLPIQYNIGSDDWVVFEPENWYDGGGSPLFTDAGTLFDDVDKTDAFELNCAGCHVVGLDLAFDMGSGEYSGAVRELGVGCESCHGPGGPMTHILYGLRGKGLDPSALETERANEVCGQCHNRGHSADAIGGKTLGYAWGFGNAYPPGSELINYFHPLDPVTETAWFWPDEKHAKGNYQQYHDFYQTPKPDHDVLCWDCHAAHGSAKKHDVVESIFEGGFTMATDNDDNTLCLACHAAEYPFEGLTEEMIADHLGNMEAIAAAVSTHSKHSYDPLDENGTNGTGRCSKCHMPKVGTSAVAYDIHSHTFEAIPGQNTLDAQAAGGMPNSCAVSCHRNPTAPNVPDFGIVDVALTAWDEISDFGVATIVQGNQDQWDSDTSRYAGVDYCGNCHGFISEYAGDQWSEWALSAHGQAYDLPAEVQDDPACLRCHTSGWDEGTPDGGFDDFFTTADDDGIQRMKNVQCESCHEPGSLHPIPSMETVGVDRSADLCGSCHQEEHHPYLEEWTLSPHAAAETSGDPADENCAGCHTMQGFLQFAEQDGFVPSVDITQFEGDAEAVVCAACHDPHMSGSDAQLRLATDVLCQKCHNTAEGNGGDPLDHATAFMFAGTGAYEYPGEVYTNSPHTDLIEEACPRCHVSSTTYEDGPLEGMGATDHSFDPVLESCQTEDCHPGLETFDRDGVQTEIDRLLQVLNEALEAFVDKESEQYLNALTNSRFVTNDGSRGIHNTAYTKKLLWDSIESLTGEAPLARYIGVDYCNNCHGNESSVAGTQYAEWNDTRHSVAYDAEGRAETPYWVDPCNWCHTVGHDESTENGGFDEAVSEADTSRMKNVQCESCHGPGSLHPAELTSVKLGVEAEVCADCHFLANDQWAGSAHMTEDITCIICHDPHDAAISNSQLRVAARNLCQTCHTDEGAVPGMIPENPQAEMFMGLGGFEYAGETYPSSAHTAVVPERCVTCHMFSEEFSSSFFTVDLSDHTTTPRIETCQECHPGLDTFNMDGVQTEIETLLGTLLEVLTNATSEDSLTDGFQQALFNYYFVLNDGSRGVHNTDYARKLLEDAVTNFGPAVIRIGTELEPTAYSLEQNYPNPFNPETEITYTISDNEMVTVTIYNILGQTVRTLMNTPQQAGRHTVLWDGKNDAGQGVVSGVYMYRLEAGQFVSTKKMTLVR